MSSRTLLIAALVLIAVARGLAADAQQAAKIATIGYLSGATREVAASNFEALRQGLRKLGDVEGRTVTLVSRYGEARAERLPELVRELRSLKVAVIVTANDQATAAVKREAPAIPIVMANSNDPVGTAFVASLAHPGGNITGLSSVSSELSGKRLELLEKLSLGSITSRCFGIPTSVEVSWTTRRPRPRPIPTTSSFNRSKCSARRISTAPSPP